jgi:TolA-binding protein
MKNTSLSKSNFIKSSPLMKGLLVAAVFTALSSQAFGFTVHDPIHTVSTFGQAGKQIVEAKNQLDQLQKQYEELQKHITKLQGLQNASMVAEDKFKERTPGEFISLDCPGAGPLSVSALFSTFNINLDSDVKTQQKQICQRISLAKDKQYNETVKVLKIVTERNKELTAIEKRRAAAKEPGEMAAVNNDIAKLQAKTQVDMQYSNAVISAYDTYIASLEDHTGKLTEGALTGNTGKKETFASAITSKFVQGAVLEGALQIARTRER